MPVLVVGLGAFGGGVGVARYLVEQGAQVTITDLKSQEQLAPALDSLADLPLCYRLGRHDETDLDRAELVVASPAVPPQSPFLQAARARGLPITSEMNLFFSQCRGRIIGVTGSNGKTTTTMLTAEILRHTGQQTYLGGNLGRSLLDQLDRIQREDCVVLELSSFQLDDLDRLGLSPEISVLCNLTPNHLDRHGTFEQYAAAKQTIFRYQSTSDVAVLNADDPWTRARVADHPADFPGRIIWFSVMGPLESGYFADGQQLVRRDTGGTQTLAPIASLRIVGRHNQANFLAAAAAAQAAGARPEHVAAAAASFEGAPHRLELVGKDKRRTFYNDSIATTPESTIAALQALEQPIYLLVGGYDKGCELDSLAHELGQRAAGVVLIGALGERLSPLLAGSGVETRHSANFRDAFEQLLSLTDSGTLLLSPAAASYDEFNDFTERGELFRQLVATQLSIP